MTVDIAREFLDDPRAEVRSMGARILADTPPHPDTELLLSVALADGDEGVWKAAASVLSHRLPWLVLPPSPVRTPPPSALETAWGQAWLRLREGIREFVRRVPSEELPESLKRWRALPGCVPDCLEVLSEAGLEDLAASFAADAGLYGSGAARSPQILLAPTYQCNIDCSYCYTKKWRSTYPDELSLEDLDALLAWMRKQGLSLVLLAGGEPTVYRHFPVLMERVRDSGMQLRLTTNGMYPPEIRDSIFPEIMDVIVVHWDQGAIAGSEGGRNLFTENLRDARRRGARAHLRYTLTEESSPEEWRPAMEVGRDLGVETLNYAFAFRSFDCDNEFVGFVPGEPAPRFERMLNAFLDDCAAFGLPAGQSKPFPLCVLSEETLGRRLLEGTVGSGCTAFRRGFTQNLTVNPDLTTIPCNAIRQPGPRLADFEDLQSVQSYNEGFLKELLFHPLAEACESCLFHYRGLCQGACLAEKHGIRSRRST